MATVVWTDPARQDLKAICDRIALDSPFKTARFAERAIAATAQLELFPLSGRVVPELRPQPLRAIISECYRIVYSVTDDIVEVVLDGGTRAAQPLA